MTWLAVGSKFLHAAELRGCGQTFRVSLQESVTGMRRGIPYRSFTKLLKRGPSTNRAANARMVAGYSFIRGCIRGWLVGAGAANTRMAAEYSFVRGGVPGWAQARVAASYSRRAACKIHTDRLNYCGCNKFLGVNAHVIMPSYLHGREMKSGSAGKETFGREISAGCCENTHAEQSTAEQNCPDG